MISQKQAAIISPVSPNAKQVFYRLQHTFTVFSIAFALLAIFVIVTVKDLKSRTYSRLILTIVTITLVSDLYLVLVLDPTYFSPLPCLVRDEPLLNIPGRTSVHHVVWVSLMFLDSPLFLSCFFHRLQVVLSPGSRWFFSSRVKQGIPIVLALLYPLLPIFLHTTMQPSGSILQYAESLSMWMPELIARADCFYPDRLQFANTLGSILMAFNFVAAILMVSLTFSTLRKHCSMSEKMRQYHRMMTIVLIIQSGVPIVFALFPLSMLFSVYLYDWDGTVIIPVCFTLISSHSFLHSIAVLATTPVYRIRMRTCIVRHTRRTTVQLMTVSHSQFSK